MSDDETQEAAAPAAPREPSGAEVNDAMLRLLRAAIPKGKAQARPMAPLVVKATRGTRMSVEKLFRGRHNNGSNQEALGETFVYGPGRVVLMLPDAIVEKFTDPNAVPEHLYLIVRVEKKFIDENTGPIVRPGLVIPRRG